MKTLTLLITLLCSLTLNAQTNQELLDMKPKDFFAHSAALQIIDTEEPNHHLLTIATFHATNLLRQKLHMTTFLPDKALYGASKLHANEMISKQFFNHINPYSNHYETPVKRVRKNGGNFQIVAENIALIPLFKSKKVGRYKYRQTNGTTEFYNLDGTPLKFMTYGEFGKSLVTDWYQSKPHRKNLMNDELTHLGLAVRIVKNEAKLGELPEAYAVQNFGTH